MARILLIVIALILYGSLFPWHFSPRHPGVNPLWNLLHAWNVPVGRWGVRDILLNLALYFPLGLFGGLAFARWSRSVRLWAPVAIGFLLSTAVECAQFYDVSRQPSAIDVVTNTAGTLAGAVMALIAPGLLQRRYRGVSAGWRRDASAGGLLLLGLGYRLFPFFPSFSLTAVSEKWTAFRAASLLDPVPLLSAFFPWLAAGYLLAAVSIRHAKLWLAVSVLLAPAEFLIYDRLPYPAEFLGATIGVFTFALFSNARALRVFAAIGFVLLLAVRGVMPFHLAGIRQAFDWRPFVATLASDWQDAIGILLEKCFFYGVAIWLLRASGMPVRSATIGVASLLAAIEVLQMWLPGRTPEITDPLLAVLLGFWIYSGRMPAGVQAHREVQGRPVARNFRRL